MESIERIASAYTQQWVAWVMLLIIAGLCAAEIFQPGHYMRAFGSLFTTKERDSIFDGSGNDHRTRWILSLNGVLLLGLGLQWVFFGGGNYSPLLYLHCAGCAALYALARAGMQEAVGYVFFTHNETDTFRRHYRYLNDCLTIVCWPLLLLALFLPGIVQSLIMGLLGLFIILYCLLLLFKLIACFHFKLASVFYIPLYFITTELVPLGALIVLTKSAGAF